MDGLKVGFRAKVFGLQSKHSAKEDLVSVLFDRLYLKRECGQPNSFFNIQAKRFASYMTWGHFSSVYMKRSETGRSSTDELKDLTCIERTDPFVQSSTWLGRTCRIRRSQRRISPAAGTMSNRKRLWRSINPPNVFSRVAKCAASLLLWCLVTDAALHAQSTYQRRRRPDLPPEKGVFLVADPQIEGGVFRQSVVLVLAHGDQGTLGLIVNRPTRTPLSQALPDVAQADKESRNLFFGGPVGLANMIFLFRSDTEQAGASHVTDDVYFSGDRQVLQKVIASRGSDRLRIYIGNSGWARGQLDMEIARGDWRIVRADAGTIFDRYPESMWQKLSHRPFPSVVALSLPGLEMRQGLFGNAISIRMRPDESTRGGGRRRDRFARPCVTECNNPLPPFPPG